MHVGDDEANPSGLPEAHRRAFPAQDTDAMQTASRIIRREDPAAQNARPLHPRVERPSLGRIIRHEELAALTVGSPTLPATTAPGESCWAAPSEPGDTDLEACFAALTRDLGLPWEENEMEACFAALSHELCLPCGEA